MAISIIEKVFREHFDYSDMDTVRMIAEASDNNQNQIMIALTSKLYDMIVAKVAKIDYSTVSSSRGDITKIQNFADLTETVNIMKNLVIEYKCDPAPISIVEQAIENMKNRTNVFKRAFVINSPVPVMLYNNIATCIVSSISFLIDTCIEYIKNPQAESFQMAVDVVAYNKTKDNLMLETLASFNEGCKSGDIDDAMKVCMSKRMKVHREAAIAGDTVEVKTDSPFMTDDEIKDPTSVVIHDKSNDEGDNVTEGFDGINAIIGKGLIALCKLIVPLIRHIVYFYFYSRQRLSDYFESNATLLEMNAYQVQMNSEIDVEQREEIYHRQMKVAEKLRKKAQRTSIDYNRSKKEAEADIAREQKKFTSKDIEYNPNDENLDNAVQSSILF